MARCTEPGSLTGSILSSRLHSAQGTLGIGAPESAGDLPHAIPCGLGDAAHDRRRPTASRSADRPSGCVAYLEPKAPASSSSALSGAGWRYLVRRGLLDSMPETVLPADQRAPPYVPGQVSCLPECRVPQTATASLWHTPSAEGSG